MRKTLTLFVALALVGGVAACDTEQEEIETMETMETEPAIEPMEDVQPDRPADAQPVMTGEFSAAGDAAGEAISGTVRIYPDGGTESGTGMEGMDAEAGEAGAGQGFMIQVAIQGLSQGEHAWHIHDAPCGETGSIALALTPTQDREGLADPIQGTQGQDEARASATVPASEMALQQLETGQYSLHVHERGGVDHGPTVACADLSEGGGQMQM